MFYAVTGPLAFVYNPVKMPDLAAIRKASSSERRKLVRDGASAVMENLDTILAMVKSSHVKYMHDELTEERDAGKRAANVIVTGVPETNASIGDVPCESDSDHEKIHVIFRKVGLELQIMSITQLGQAETLPNQEDH